MGENPDWYNKFSKYISDGLHLHDDDIKAAAQIHRFIRWWLEQVRNLLAVSAFWFLAEKSNSLLLKILAGISGLLFLPTSQRGQTTFTFASFHT
jgi:hypothetical protein